MGSGAGPVKRNISEENGVAGRASYPITIPNKY
jgi:hypothetical protein